MLTRYQNKMVFKVVCAFALVFVSSAFAEEQKPSWELSIDGDSSLLNCTLQTEKLDKIWEKLKVEKKQGICELVEKSIKTSEKDKNGKVAWAVMDYLENSDFGTLIGTFVSNTIGNSFDLGGYAKCDISALPKIEDSSLADYCKESNLTELSPIAILGIGSVDAEGIIGGGAENDFNLTKVSDRKFGVGSNGEPAITGKELYEEANGTDGGVPITGGYIYKELKEDPMGSTAVAVNSFDKATLVLKDYVLKATGKSDISQLKLPKTKAQSIDLVDETVQLSTRLDVDINEFTDTLTRRLIGEFAHKDDTHDTKKKIMLVAVGKKYRDRNGSVFEKHKEKHIDELSLAQYRAIEQNLSAEYFESNESGLADIYKAIEYEAKAEYASEQLLMTADPNYIADPSEARLAYIKDSQKNAFKYAALIQQEKNKRLKYKIAMKVKRKKQLIDLAKNMAQVRASRFRDDIAKSEIADLLKKVDESVKVEVDKDEKDAENPSEKDSEKDSYDNVDDKPNDKTYPRKMTEEEKIMFEDEIKKRTSDW